MLSQFDRVELEPLLLLCLLAVLQLFARSTLQAQFRLMMYFSKKKY